MTKNNKTYAYATTIIERKECGYERDQEGVYGRIGGRKGNYVNVL